ncbi:Deoxyribose operon repressor [bioreactor metagenome]|jgi:DeoR family deoxyribose operon repressor|uniref:Deoxyribose operon repressor n=1 Tax=bioreactor metagenome TaxID=1076179 RepID=A0A644TQ02_9ZZZZ|nr:DeoR/GlpR family DNA-binding transcription regulator [Spirochaetia bacterium]
MMQDKRTARFNQLTSILRKNGGARISELAGILSVSHMTVRRDLEILERQGVVNVFHGSVVFNEISASSTTEPGSEYLAKIVEITNIVEKRKIGRKAAELINPHDVIIIDSGSTAEQVARAIPEDMPLTLICYSLNVLQAVARKPKINIIVAGGHYHSDTLMFESPEGIALLQRNRAIKAFISAAGVNLSLGVTCLHDYERNTKTAVLQNALTKILIVDSSKIGKVFPSFFANLKDFDTMITDNKIREEDAAVIQDLNIEVVIS